MSERPPFREEMFVSPGIMSQIWIKYFNKLIVTSALTEIILGTADQITVTDNGDDTITLSLPQDIDTDADVEFDSVTLGDLTASRMLSTDANKKIISIANLASWVAGTANQITVTNDGDGTITLAAPQDLHTGATVTFAGANVGAGANQVQIDSTGELTLTGTARIYRYIRVSGASWKLGATAPTVSRLSTFPTLIFVVGDDAHYSLICPYRMVAGSVINVQVDFTHRDAGDTGTAEWSLEYRNVAEGESVVGATTTISGISGATAQHDLARVQLTTGIIGAVAHDDIGLILSHTNGGTIGVNVDLINVHFEFLMDKLGEST